MKKVIHLGLSIAAASMLYAEEMQLETIEVEETGTSIVVKDVAGEEVRSADLADALYRLDPNVQLVRRSGIANDIIVRGMRKDNINVLIDGGKLYGGCPNRMDPPISHVLANNVDNIVIKEGPYDVEHFGTLTGLVEVNTLKPSQEKQGEINLNAGSWDYYKLGARFSGGNEWLRMMVGGSTESSGQYKDGDGNTLADQVKNFAAASNSPKVKGAQYAPEHYHMDAYEKKTGMIKLFADVADNQELRLSYTVNQSDDVMYPSTPMDAKEDNSNLFNAEYIVRNLGEWSKKLKLKFYNSWVYHPMGNYYRRSAVAKGIIENIMHSRIYGGVVKNSMDLYGGTLKIGVDASRRTWDGEYRSSKGLPFDGKASIDNSKTKDVGVFANYTKTIGAFDLDAGVRYDMARVESDVPETETNDYNAFGGYLFGTYRLDEQMRLFGGVGTSIRVPDGKELYFQDKVGGALHGNPDLNEVRNTQVDIGMEAEAFESATVRIKGFYSKLKDFIFYNNTYPIAPDVKGRYENQDATLYGISVDGTYALNDEIYFDGGIAWLRGKKDDPLTGQSDKDMPNIAPLKGTLGANWDFDETATARLAMVAAGGWRDYDGDNGEQRLPGYAVFNFKLKKDFLNRYEVTLGVDNIFDKTYAITNTYADMTLVTGGQPMLLNEPGRYIYGNLTWHF
ncbi:TonB-dependent receptor [Hydrogenimonas urashimensis]|uniref:TonB-dependent receptor n=1 Tax=Hydrogenimonas urashimensis TaxID=2740515 RepID=UPI0019161814|nr:TonB-dependent receptor [Hydrogenimonas urashimensis]